MAGFKVRGQGKSKISVSVPRFMPRLNLHIWAAVEPQQRGLELWKDASKAIQESEGKFPEKHIQFACCHAYNFGVKAWYYGRMQDAEQWLALAWKLSKSKNLTMDDATLEKIRLVSALTLCSCNSVDAQDC
jgi:hypothetical protein